MISPVVFAGPVAANVIAAAVLTWTPGWSPGTYFGVRVASEYRNSRGAGETRRSFVFKIWAATAIAILLSVASWTGGGFWLAPLGFAIQFGTAMLAFRSGWRATLPHGVAGESTGTAQSFGGRPRVPGGAAAVVTPFLLLVTVFFYLLSKWNSIPARFPVHWDLEGHANGWSERSVQGVFGPLLIAFLVLVFITGLIAAQVRMPRRATAGSGLEWRNRAVLAIPVTVMWIIAVMFSLAALTPVIIRNGRFPIPAFVVLLIPIGGIIAAIWFAARAYAEPTDAPADDTPNECWKWGQFYYNPGDSSILVEKRFGIGYTLNFARWQSWLMLAVFLALPIGILAIARH